MHEQTVTIATGFLLLIGLAFFLGYDLGSRGEAKKTRRTLQQFAKLVEQVKSWKSSPEGTAYSRGYSQGYTDCLTNVNAFLERHPDDEPT